MISVEKQIVNRIYGNGRGWSFSKIDFVDIGSSSAVEQGLSRLAKKDTIRRVIPGVYEYPRYSKLLNQNLSPDVDAVAHAIARKNGWNIEISGNAALNLLGLSTQVPGKYVYLSDCRSKTYEIGKQELIFKKSRLKDMGVKMDETAILVQALRALNRKTLTDKERTKVRKYFGEKVGKKILKDARYTTTWVYEEIKRIFVEG
ncbi:MAG: hypothetical protein HOM20_11840 [Porticoccaceae bacterium]|nr:hypothetical protein [Porticoccaceae bacterium]